MSKNIVFEGWLTKSPPTKRIWRTKWRRRWFALRQSGELPGQYFLDYYADRNCRRLKGTINLDLCEQVDAGLHMERSTNGTLDPKLRGSVFTIQTQSRTYHLEADCEAEMEKWVDAICRVCGLRATEDSSNDEHRRNIPLSTVTSINEQFDSTGPYIPISECITGVRAQDEQRAFTFDPQNIVISTRSPFDDLPNNKSTQVCMTQPQARVNNPEYSENESNPSDEDCKSLNASQSNIQDWAAAKSFTKLSISPKKNGVSEVGPPVPPRPPKTFAMSREVPNETFHAPRIHGPPESPDHSATYGNRKVWLRDPHTMYGAPPSPGRSRFSPSNALRITDDEEEYSSGHLSMYCNMSSLPPAVDRALKPRHSGHSFGQITLGKDGFQVHQEQIKADVLQYLDLDLHTSTPVPQPQNAPRKTVQFAHGKSLSTVEPDSAYKTVDFVKTEAFNITRQDAEASRSHQH